MKKVQLERVLQSLEPLPSPRSDIEQYPTPAAIAAEVAFIALAKGDIARRKLLDAGCGNGVLAIAAKLLGAADVLGVDVDPGALALAARNAQRTGVEVEWRRADIRSVEGTFDTVLTNPPFGSQSRHADLPFLDKALAVGRVVYSFHNGVTEAYIARRIEGRGGRITDRVPNQIPLSRTYRIQTPEVRWIPLVLFRTQAAKA